MSEVTGRNRSDQPNGKRLEKSTLAASTLACYVFIYKLQTNSEYRQFTIAETLQVAKLCFSYVQTSSKPAIRCRKVQLISFLRASTVDFLRCLELKFDCVCTCEKATDRRCGHDMAFSKVCLEFVHMKTQHIEGVGCSFFPLQTCIFSASQLFLPQTRVFFHLMFFSASFQICWLAVRRESWPWQ